MSPLKLTTVRQKETNTLRLPKSASLQLYEGLLFLFWGAFSILSVWDESKMEILDFYRKHLPAGLLLLPTSTKLILMVPLLMACVALCMWGARTTWSIHRSRQLVIRTKKIFFLIPFGTKKWKYSELSALKMAKGNRREPFKLFLETASGKRYLLERMKNEKKLKLLAKKIQETCPLRFQYFHA